MSKRRTHHASAARSAPFGTDVQPKLNVKIIGGVAVEIPVDTPPSSAGSSERGTPDLKTGPHGTPPLQTQPQNADYISKDSRDSSHENQRAPPHMGIHPTTSPSDSSNSHIHDQFGRRNSFPNPHKILPPISSPNMHQGPNKDHNSYNQQPPYSHPSTAIPPTISSPSHPEVTLSEQLRSYLIDYDAYRFKEMYSDLAEFDRKLSGHVTKAQVNMMSLKHQLPIPTTLMRLVLSNFGHDSNPDLVNYEKLIQYLARVQLGTAQAETLIQESVKKFVDSGTSFTNGKEGLDYEIAKFEKGEELAQLQRFEAEKDLISEGTSQSDREETIEEIPKKVIYVASKKPLKTFPEQENAKFMSLLKQQYVIGEHSGHDFDAMREKFADLDKQGTGTVTRKEIDQICLFYRVPVQGSLMDKLLQRCDTGSGQLSWIEFVDYLEKAQPQAKTASKVRIEHTVETSERPTTWPTTKGTERTARESTKQRGLPEQVDEIPAWERRKPLGRLETRSPKKGISAVEHEITRNDTPSEDRVSPTLPPTPHGGDQSEVAQLKALARQHRQKRENQQRAAMQNRQVAQRADDDPWFDRFMHLARGVYNSDSTNSGFLEREEMFRLIKNYNLIYQLGMTTPRIQSIVTSLSNGVNEVPIEPVLASLRQEKPK